MYKYLKLNQSPRAAGPSWFIFFKPWKWKRVDKYGEDVGSISCSIDIDGVKRNNLRLKLSIESTW